MQSSTVNKISRRGRCCPRPGISVVDPAAEHSTASSVALSAPFLWVFSTASSAWLICELRIKAANTTSEVKNTTPTTMTRRIFTGCLCHENGRPEQSTKAHKALRLPQKNNYSTFADFLGYLPTVGRTPSRIFIFCDGLKRFHQGFFVELGALRGIVCILPRSTNYAPAPYVR